MTKPPRTFDTGQPLIWKLMAAGVVALVFFCIKEFITYNEEPSMQTFYGEVKAQQLPDGSGIMLNANSSVMISPEWDKGKDREVWLKGEAFFSVRQVPRNSRFIVHAARYDVIATGTQFNVMNRNNTFNVMVKDGSVAIRAGNINTGKEIILHPGEYAAFINQQILKETEDTSRVFAWKSKKIVFKQSSLKEVALFIETYYGMKVIALPGIDMATMVSGEMSNTDFNALLQALSRITHLHFSVLNHEITISKG